MTSPGRPEAGYYKQRMVRGGPWVAIKIWPGISLDEGAEEQWFAMRNGEEVGIWDVWPGCSGRPISRDEYETMLPHPEPGRRVEISKSKPIF